VRLWAGIGVRSQESGVRSKRKRTREQGSKATREQSCAPAFSVLTQVGLWIAPQDSRTINSIGTTLCASVGLP